MVSVKLCSDDPCCQGNENLPNFNKKIAITLLVEEISSSYRNKSCIVNSQIGIGESKNVIIFDHLFTGSVIRRKRSGRVRIFSGNQQEMLQLVTHERIVTGSLELVAGLDMTPAIHDNCLSPKSQM